MSSSWNMGYNTDLQYTFGYFRELSPLYGRFIFLHNGIEYPNMKNGTACELGFGQGVSVCVHGVTADTKWYGTDFNPAHANFARKLAEISLLEADLNDAAFDEFASREDLPMFDYICLHGIWSWISRENQNVIINFIRKKLKVGGVVYVSYNVSPGFMMFEPIRHLIYQFHKHVLNDSIPYEKQMEMIQAYLDQIMDANPSICAVIPGLKERIKDTFKHDFHYLKGEYLNDCWDIIHFSDMAETMDRAKMSFACSATVSEMIDSLNLTPDQIKLLEPMRGSVMYDNTRDLIVFQQFRRDFFTKGARKLSPEQRVRQIKESCFVMSITKDKVKYEYVARVGKANLKEELYRPIIELMGDYKVRSVAEICDTLSKNNDRFNLDTVYNCLVMLVISGQFSPAVKANELSSEVKKRTKAYNSAVIHREALSNVNYLASPIIQSAVLFSDLQLMALRLYLNNTKLNAEQVCERLLSELKIRGVSVTDEENRSVTDEQALRERILNMCNDLFEMHLPMLSGLLII